jgi:hypothetical protein
MSLANRVVAAAGLYAGGDIDQRARGGGQRQVVAPDRCDAVAVPAGVDDDVGGPPQSAAAARDGQVHGAGDVVAEIQHGARAVV